MNQDIQNKKQGSGTGTGAAVTFLDPLRNQDQFDLNRSSQKSSSNQPGGQLDDEDFEVSRIPDEEELKAGDNSSQEMMTVLDQEEVKREIMMEFGGTEIEVSRDTRKNNLAFDEDEYEFNQGSGGGGGGDSSQEISMRDIAIMHMAKKNLSFELEYIQIVCENLSGINVSNHFQEYSKKMDENPMLALQKIEEEKSGKGVKFADEVKTKKSKEEEAKQSKLITFLESAYSKLNQMKKEILRDDNKMSREELKKVLTTMACLLERSRLYLDSFIYPRDLSLNLIDVQIEESAIVDKKRQMHLTERLYTIVYKDFFTAYERAVLFRDKIEKYAGQEIEDHQQLLHANTKVSVQLDDDILEDDRESIQIASQEIEVNKLGKDAEEAKKHLSRKDGAVANDMRNMIRILNGFNPNFPTFTAIEEIMDNEFNFILKLKSPMPQSHEFQFTLFQENSQSFSMTAVYDYSQSLNVQNDQSFFFVNIPLKAILTGNLALIIKIVEKRYSKSPSSSLSLLGQQDVNSCNKVMKGYSVLPISKLFWISQLRVKQVYQIREAQIYKTLPKGHLIEDKYATMIEKREFKKLKDANLTQHFNLSYVYKIEPKNKDEQFKRKNHFIVRPVNFDQSSFLSKDSSQSDNHMKQKVEKYRFNDLQIELNNAVFTDALEKKTPVIRVEVALRDNYGIIYDTVYKTITDATFNFQQTYESLIYPLDTNEFRINEGFFVRIPTKSLDTLKKIYLIFQVQTLVTQKDSKGKQIKTSNFTNDLEQLQFKTEYVAALPLYDPNEKCILKNKQYALELYQIEDSKKPIPHKYEHFHLDTKISNLKPTRELLQVKLKLISNEFTHNTYINNLLLIKDALMQEYEIETILKELKNLKDTNDQILFHDKILDKLFQLMSTNKDDGISELIFETIIMMIDLFQSRFNDYKEILENYIQNHFAQSKVYHALLQQIHKVSEKILAGLTENSQNEQKNGYILMTLKYLGIVLKIVRNSYLEALSCQQQDSGNNNGDHPNDVASDLIDSASMSGSILQMNPGFGNQQPMKKGTIKEEDEDLDSDEDMDGRFGDDQKLAARASKLRKGAIRRTTYNQADESLGQGPVKIHQQSTDLTKRQFGVKIQRSLKNIFEGCHKDAMRTTLSLRAILYENITQIFDNITDFMDDQFLQSVLHYIYEEQHVQLLGVSNGLGGAQNKDSKNNPQGPSDKIGTSQKPSGPAQGGILKRSGDEQVLPSNNKLLNKNTRRSELQSVGGQVILLDLDFFQQEANLKALQDYNWINEEAITKIKIIAMGRLLSNGIFEKVQGDTNKIVMAFCKNIEKNHLKRPELSIHVFYFLYELFQYLKSPDEFTEIENAAESSKLQIFSKRSLDMRDFFAKILPDISGHLQNLLGDANIDDRVKEAKLPNECLKPFTEKSSLVLMSLINTITIDKFKQIIFNEPKKLLNVVKNLKKLSAKMAFQGPYSVFFEKKKIQVIRKTIMFIVQILIDKEPQQIPLEYHVIISQCRLMIIYLWNKLEKIKEDFKQTSRSKALVKDQLKVYKGKMLEIFRVFWTKFRYLGQPWLTIKNSMTKQFISFIKMSESKAIQLYMEVISDTITYEYQETKDVYHTSSSLYKVFYDLNNSTGSNAIKFYEAFEKIMCEKNLTFQTNADFQNIIRQRFQQMQALSDAVANVNLSKQQMKENIFYRAYCMAQLMEVLWELKLFQTFLDNQASFESLNKQLENNLEVAYTSLRFVESLEHQSEDDRSKIGQREIFARIQLNSLQKVQQYFTKAEFFEKAIEILNKQKDIAENMLFDYEMVSMIVEQQFKLYRQLAQDQDRHFAVYFKVGFYGKSFPIMLRNKEFIFRARKLNKRSDVKDRLQRYFADAIFIEHNNQPDVQTTQSEKKSIQIQKVDALTYVEMKDFGLLENFKDKEEIRIGKKAKDLPAKQRNYFLENFKNQFYIQKMLDTKSDDELQRDRLIEIFKVKNKFPTVFNMQEIIKTKKIIRHAIDEGIRNVQSIIDSIETMKKTAITSEDPNDYQFLTSQIRAALESPIQGGVEKYINTFITESNLRGVQREKMILLFSKIEECNQVINEGIQAIKTFNYQETMVNKINGDYTNFKEKINKVRLYIDGRNMH